jgi:hypothetical protein
MSLRHILSQPKRDWQAKAPTSEAEIAHLQSQARDDLPLEYLELLRFSNWRRMPDMLGAD